MSKLLDNFIAENRASFDEYEPSTKVWNNINEQLGNAKVIAIQKANVKKLNIYKWVAAASIALLIGVSTILVLKNSAPHIAYIPTEKPSENAVTVENKSTKITQVDTQISKRTPLLSVEKKVEKKLISIKKSTIKIDTILDEMVAFKKTQEHFATLISYKEKAIKNLSDADTTVYKNFTNDMKSLNISYEKLSKQLPITNNKPALVNALIYNLQIQIELLNKQLIILNKIESTQKKEKYENNI